MIPLFRIFQPSPLTPSQTLNSSQGKLIFKTHQYLCVLVGEGASLIGILGAPEKYASLLSNSQAGLSIQFNEQEGNSHNPLQAFPGGPVQTHYEQSTCIVTK